jgi:MYXO-CTERM domain-containing protein
MTIIRFLRLAALLAATGMTPALASAATFMNIDFEGDVAGSAPSVSPPGSPMTKPSAIGGYTATTSDNPPTAANGTIVVGSAPGIAQGAIMTTNPANAVTGALWMDNNGFGAVGQQIRMSFDVNILAAPTVAVTQPKLLAGGGTAGIILGMNAFTNSGSQQSFRFAAAPTSETGGVFAFRSADNTTLVDFFNYVEGTTYNVAIEADYTTGKVKAFVDGIEKISNHAFLLVNEPSAVTGEYFFHLNGEAGYANSVAIDNIQSSVVPEPASVAMAGVAVLGMLAARRRRSV